MTHQRFVIVSNTDSAFEIDGAEVHRRPVPWMNRLVREGAVIADAPGEAVPRLRPGAALADLARYGPSMLDADDIDLELLEEDELVLLKRLAKGSGLLQELGGRRVEPLPPSGSVEQVPVVLYKATPWPGAAVSSSRVSRRALALSMRSTHGVSAASYAPERKDLICARGLAAG